MFIKMPDGSVLDETGKILFFSIDRFIKDICEGNCCFLCGVSPEKAEFNDEHVIPNWILNRYNLQGKFVTLSNGTAFPYSKYKVPCCVECNSLLANRFETPISTLTQKGYDAVVEYVRIPGGLLQIFTWLMLIFFKTHMKDKFLMLHRNPNKGHGKIADFYTWEELHHIHCVIRSFYTGALLEPSVLGSTFILKAHTGTAYGDFDYKDLYAPKTVLLRLGEVAFVVALTDCCAASILMKDMIFEKINSVDAILSHGQLREVMSHVSFINLYLTEHPVFESKFRVAQDIYLIVGETPKTVQLNPTEPSDFGLMMYSCCNDIVDTIPIDQKENVTKHMKEGRWSYFPVNSQ